MLNKKARIFTSDVSDKARRAFFVCLILALIALVPGGNAFFTWLESKASDIFFYFKPYATSDEKDSPAIIVLKDQAFFQRFSRDPNRSDFSNMLDLIAGSGADIAALDFIYDQPSNNTSDQKFCESLKRFKLPIAAEHFVNRGKQTFEQINIIDANSHRPPWPLPLFKPIENSISAKGLINLIPDLDSTIRFAPLAFHPIESESFRPTLGYASYVAWLITKKETELIDAAKKHGDLPASGLLLGTLKKGPFVFNSTGHKGIDQMTRRLEMKYAARFISFLFPEKKEELKEAAEKLQINALTDKTWLEMPSQKLPIIGSYETPCLRLNFSQTPPPNTGDCIPSVSLGTLLKTDNDIRHADKIFKPDLVVSNNSKVQSFEVDFTWQAPGSGNISGKISLFSLQPVSNAYLRIEMIDSGYWLETKSDKNGYYKFNGLPSGPFIVTAIIFENSGWQKFTHTGKILSSETIILPEIFCVNSRCNVNTAKYPGNEDICFFGEPLQLAKSDKDGRIYLEQIPSGCSIVPLNDEINFDHFEGSKLFDEDGNPIPNEIFAIISDDQNWKKSFYQRLAPGKNEISLPTSLDCRIAVFSDSRGTTNQNTLDLTLLPDKLTVEKFPDISREESNKSAGLILTSQSGFDEALLFNETETMFRLKANQCLSLPVGNYRVLAKKGDLRGKFNELSLSFKDKAVFIGTALMEDQDFVETPLNFMNPSFAHLPGVNIHANLFKNLVNCDFLEPVFFHPDRAPTFWPVLQMLLIIPVLVFCNSIFFSRGAISGGLCILLSTALWLIAGHIAFLNRLLVPVFFPGINFVSFGIVRGYISWAISKRKESETRSTFGRFISSAVVDEILKNPDRIKPGGEKKELTVMFTDLAGFTTISEKLPPEQLTELMNEYLGEMTNVLFKYGGTLDKYIGDAIMAFWNHPKEQPEHPQMAAECAIAMQKKLAELREKWVKQGLPEVMVRAGINTAQCMVGFIGSSIQMNFTCLGDGVNLASRLEGANKPYDTLIMISEPVFKRIDKEKFSTRFLDYLAVKGKDQPIKVYELRGLKSEEAKEWLEASPVYHLAIENYLERNWDEAIKLLKTVQKLVPGDKPTEIFIERCEHFKSEPPPENWDGRYILKTK
ncbi:MAG: hypothetical protein Kow0029_03410 [Candidatus Rifleibacteriota bacterium]